MTHNAGSLPVRKWAECGLASLRRLQAHASLRRVSAGLKSLSQRNFRLTWQIDSGSTSLSSIKCEALACAPVERFPTTEGTLVSLGEQSCAAQPR